VSQRMVLQLGRMFGIPGLRGNPVLPHRLHLCSLITSMWTFYMYVEVVASGQ